MFFLKKFWYWCRIPSANYSAQKLQQLAEADFGLACRVLQSRKAYQTINNSVYTAFLYTRYLKGAANDRRARRLRDALRKQETSIITIAEQSHEAAAILFETPQTFAQFDALKIRDLLIKHPQNFLLRVWPRVTAEQNHIVDIIAQALNQRPAQLGRLIVMLGKLEPSADKTINFLRMINEQQNLVELAKTQLRFAEVLLRNPHILRFIPEQKTLIDIMLSHNMIQRFAGVIATLKLDQAVRDDVKIASRFFSELTPEILTHLFTLEERMNIALKHGDEFCRKHISQCLPDIGTNTQLEYPMLKKICRKFTRDQFRIALIKLRDQTETARALAYWYGRYQSTITQCALRDAEFAESLFAYPVLFRIMSPQECLEVAIKHIPRASDNFSDSLAARYIHSLINCACDDVEAAILFIQQPALVEAADRDVLNICTIHRGNKAFEQALQKSILSTVEKESQMSRLNSLSAEVDAALLNGDSPISTNTPAELKLRRLLIEYENLKFDSPIVAKKASPVPKRKWWQFFKRKQPQQPQSEPVILQVPEQRQLRQFTDHSEREANHAERKDLTARAMAVINDDFHYPAARELLTSEMWLDMSSVEKAALLSTLFSVTFDESEIQYEQQAQFLQKLREHELVDKTRNIIEVLALALADEHAFSLINCCPALWACLQPEERTQLLSHYRSEHPQTDPISAYADALVILAVDAKTYQPLTHELVAQLNKKINRWIARNSPDRGFNDAQTIANRDKLMEFKNALKQYMQTLDQDDTGFTTYEQRSWGLGP